MVRKNPVAEEYARTAPYYESRWSFYVDATTRNTIERINIKSTDKILDVGCGTGSLLYRLASSCPDAKLSGVDLVPEMLKVAHQRLPENVMLCAGLAEHIPFENNHFDIVISCNMFHYIRHPSLALKEMYRVLRPGGQLVLTDWCHDYITCQVCELYLRLSNRAHFRIYRTGECKGLLEQAGYTDVQIEKFKINWLWGLMTAKGKK
ncbi:MAG: methyltransferase domain-containing protein [Desulfamplus sp.]|nr:methyltransferase domain-containing protein [Desulfamplus sp.]